MIRRLLLGALLALLPQLASAQLPMQQMTWAPSASGGGAYVGPGDVVTTGWVAYFSMGQAFTAAYAAAGGNAFDGTRMSDSAVCTVKFASNGNIDHTTAYCPGPSTWPAFCPGYGDCRLSKLYNQAGGTACSGSCDLIAIGTSHYNVSHDCISAGTGDCIADVADYTLQSSGTISQAQPLSIVSVSNCYAACNSGLAFGILGEQLITNGFGVSFGGSGLQAWFANFSTPTVSSPTVAVGTWSHAAVSVTSGTCTLYANGTGGTSGSCGTNPVADKLTMGWAVDTSLTMGVGVMEAGLNSAALSSGQIASLNANAASRYGIP